MGYQIEPWRLAIYQFQAAVPRPLTNIFRPFISLLSEFVEGVDLAREPSAAESVTKACANLTILVKMFQDQYYLGDPAGAEKDRIHIMCGLVIEALAGLTANKLREIKAGHHMRLSQMHAEHDRAIVQQRAIDQAGAAADLQVRVEQEAARMNAHEVMNVVAQSDASLRLEGDEIVIVGVADNRITQLVQHKKAELIEILRVKSAEVRV